MPYFVAQNKGASLDIAHQRLHNQQLAQHTFTKPEDVVGWLGAVQSQDYAGAKWALGQRIPGATDADMDQAFDSGAILRTHALRPTWHFVTPADIGWVLAATAPRVHALNAYYYHKLGLDDDIFAQTNDLMAKALGGGNYLTRQELMSLLRQAGIDTGDTIRGSYIMMRAELDGVICSGPRRGRQFTYALLDERAPQAGTLERDEALAELARRYFMSHGPATVKDMVWWSSLTVSEAKVGIEMCKSDFAHDVVGGHTYWFSASIQNPLPAKDTSPVAYLLPNYDEYISYKDRSAMFDPSNAGKMDPVSNTVFANMIIINGKMVGTWKRTLATSEVIIDTGLFAPLNKAETRAVADAADHCSRFLGVPVTLHI